MSRIIILDSGPLGMAVHPTAKGVAKQCQAWLDKLLQQGERIANYRKIIMRNVVKGSNNVLKT